MINQYDMVVRQNRELQKELAVYKKMVLFMARAIPCDCCRSNDCQWRDEDNIIECIENYKQQAIKELKNASI